MCYSRNAMIENFEKMVNYAHQADPTGQRFQQFAKDPLPPWAVDLQETLEADSSTAIEFFQLAQNDCPQCGGFGYTMETNGEDGETMVGCFRCWVAHQERSIPTLVDAV